AFRSVEYQANIILRKMENNLKLSDILRFSAAPGYSEHHTGCALDLTTTDIDDLCENFDQTIAFEWLQQHGINYGFSLSYPKNITHKIAYEPWHWACL
ncbi:MAG TPA: D-alanyl-D-alanine carboxypeptidase family protein, partial [Gammaproteobacteria bacterium]|nr:D-alanyl-D-alanine carboxypeptidase family protein [Gammaproteobacteria bacterium]